MFETDKTLCMKFIHGNEGAFNTLASKWQNHILNFAYQYLGDEENARKNNAPELELTYNWDSDEVLERGRSWGHLAYYYDDIYKACNDLMDKGVVINRPPRDGRIAFIKSPDNISVELIQKGEALQPVEPWASMENVGDW